MEISIIFLFYILYIFLILQILAKSLSSADVKNQACFINYICSRILMNNSNYL